MRRGYAFRWPFLAALLFLLACLHFVAVGSLLRRAGAISLSDGIAVVGFGVVLITAVVSVMAARAVSVHALAWWAYGWCLWAVLAALSVAWMLDDPTRSRNADREVVLSVLSVLNTTFFVAAALALMDKTTIMVRSAIYRALAVSGAAIVLAVVVSRIFDVPWATTLVECLYSAFATVLLARAMHRFLDKGELPKVLGRSFSLRFASAAVVAFFLLFGFVQSSVVLWEQFPVVEALFDLVSVQLSAGMALLFLSLVVVNRYWGTQSELSSLLDYVSVGVLSIDDKLKVLQANSAALRMCGLSKVELQGRNVAAAVFCSLFEARELLDEALASGTARPRLVRCKFFIGRDDRFEERTRVVSARMTQGAGSEDRSIVLTLFPERSSEYWSFGDVCDPRAEEPHDALGSRVLSRPGNAGDGSR